MKISVVIPVINEETRIESAILRALSLSAYEIIVVDGGSTDATRELAKAFEKEGSVRLIQSPPGRARQQNAGAASSSGHVLLFLHADTWLAPAGCDQIRDALERGAAVTGAFRQRIDNAKAIYRLIERGNALRVKWWGLPYGDQGIFVRKEVFDRIGGFPDIPIMEDYVLSQRLKKTWRPVLLPGPLHVDARRWEKSGPICQTLRNWRIIFSYRLGTPPERLAKNYARHDQ